MRVNYVAVSVWFHVLHVRGERGSFQVVFVVSVPWFYIQFGRQVFAEVSRLLNVVRDFFRVIVAPFRDGVRSQRVIRDYVFYCVPRFEYLMDFQRIFCDGFRIYGGLVPGFVCFYFVYDDLC